MNRKRDLRQIDWRGAGGKLRGMSSEEQRIVELLVIGRTQPEIGRELGLHRSAVWRRVKKLRDRLTETTEAGL